MPILTSLYVWSSRGQAKNNGGQADLFDTFPKERQNFSVISIPANQCQLMKCPHEDRPMSPYRRTHRLFQFSHDCPRPHPNKTTSPHPRPQGQQTCLRPKPGNHKRPHSVRGLMIKVLNYGFPMTWLEL